MKNAENFKKGGSAPNSFNKMPEEGNTNRGFLDVLSIIIEDIMDY